MRTDLKKLDDHYSRIFCCSAQLLHCSDASVPALYRSLLTELERLFAHEQALMERAGFPAIQCHLEQHARALRALHRLHPSVMQGDYAKARVTGGQLLADWLSLHIETQDTVLSMWITEREASTVEQLTERHKGQRNPAIQYGRLVGDTRNPLYMPHPSSASRRPDSVDPAA